MSSLAKLNANRMNAKSSTGPKSAAGRRRASQNARRHGLNIPVLLDPILAQAVKVLARQLRQDFENLDLPDAAYAVAEAEIDLKRIRTFKRDLFRRLNAALHAPTRNEWRSEPNSNFSGGQKVEADATALLEQMLRIDRYERRALARRQSALRRFTSDDEVATATLTKSGKTKPKKPTISKGGRNHWSPALKPSRQRLPVLANHNEEEDQHEPVEEQQEHAPDRAEHAKDDHGNSAQAETEEREADDDRAVGEGAPAEEDGRLGIAADVDSRLKTCTTDVTGNKILRYPTCAA